jgi:small subunit ribosomal protein S11
MKQQQKNTNVQQVERFGLKYYTSALLGKAVVQQGTQNTDYTKKKRYSFSGRKSRALAWAFLSQRRPGKLYEEKYLAKQLDEEPQEATTDGIALKKSAIPNNCDDLKKGIIHVFYNRNNFIITLTDSSGNTIAQESAGSLGHRGRNRKTPLVAEEASTKIGETAIHKGIYVVDIVFRGKAYQNQRLGVIMKGLSTNNIIITNIFKDVRVPHGGCRGKKQRRV